jgi:hypothetical protein
MGNLMMWPYSGLCIHSMLAAYSRGGGGGKRHNYVLPGESRQVLE